MAAGESIKAIVPQLARIINAPSPPMETGQGDLIKIFLDETRNYYYTDFVFRCVFDRIFRGGLYSLEFTADGPSDKFYNESDEGKICHLFYRLACKLAYHYCGIYAKKGRPYEMLALLIFNHHQSFEGRSFAEIGGASNPRIIGDLLKASCHVRTESPDYVEMWGELAERHKSLEKKADSKTLKTIKRNIEEISINELPCRLDRVFSMNCFEHIQDLELALKNLRELGSNQLYIYTTFYPIYSYYLNGDHGSVPKQISSEFPGFHHYSDKQKRASIKKVYPNHNEAAIMSLLGETSFNPIQLINKLNYEDYRKLFFESDLNIVVCDEIHTGLFWFSESHRKSYSKLEPKPTAFPDVIGMRAILKKDSTANIFDSMITNSTIQMPMG